MVIDDQKKKSVNHTAKRIVPFRAKNYRQLTTIDGGQGWSTINNNYQQLTEDKIGQQSTTIINNCDDHEWSTIINNYPKLVVSNKKRK